jgi:hypothetical protein
VRGKWGQFKKQVWHGQTNLFLFAYRGLDIPAANTPAGRPFAAIPGANAKAGASDAMHLRLNEGRGLADNSGFSHPPTRPSGPK